MEMAGEDRTAACQALTATVREEIVSLHQFFVDWYSGQLEQSSFEPGFLARMDPRFTMIEPGGRLLRFNELKSLLRQRRGSNPDFRIAIRQVCVQRASERYVFATYQEWQRNALASEPADNARISTVLFRRDEGLQWLHVHETWLPEAVRAAGSFSF